jgi:biotin transporter BioY
MQSRLTSGIEVTTARAGGFLLSWGVTVFWLPSALNTEIAADKAFSVTAVYFVVSWVWNYFVRRGFNAQENNQKI